MLFIVSAHDLVGMYLAIELQSLSFYVIAAFQRNNEFSAEAGLKYFILGALSSGLLLFGESILYGLTGITNLEELTKLFTFFSSAPQSYGHGEVNLATVTYQANDMAMNLVDHGEVVVENQGLVVNAIAMGLLFMLVAFLFKISAVPFHM
jgi:NADH:ubiquinone oxidoreductase subunit 2 (subunit N)